ncbi:MAG: hypothetical protein PHQ40_16840 [Anaerolineaceae bacterium]|nr:hypothetical protein [Anaerolineaceae bacterium]
MGPSIKVTRFADRYYLFSHWDTDLPIAVSLMQVGTCPTCGQAFVTVQPCEDGPYLLKALTGARRMIADYIGRSGEELSILVCQGDCARCGGCGRQIVLPAAELLDADRTPFGRYAMWKSEKRNG